MIRTTHKASLTKKKGKRKDKTPTHNAWSLNYNSNLTLNMHKAIRKNQYPRFKADLNLSLLFPCTYQLRFQLFSNFNEDDERLGKSNYS